MLLGPPAGGKGTQAGYLAERYGTLAAARLDGLLPPKNGACLSLQLQGIFEYTFIGLLYSGMLIKYGLNLFLHTTLHGPTPARQDECIPHLQ